MIFQNFPNLSPATVTKNSKVWFDTNKTTIQNCLKYDEYKDCENNMQQYYETMEETVKPWKYNFYDEYCIALYDTLHHTLKGYF